MKIIDAILKEIEGEVSGAAPITSENVGLVKEVKDGVVTLSGLTDVGYGEVVSFKNGDQGLVVDLREDEVAAIHFGDYTKLREGDAVKSTGQILSVPVGEAFLGRVVDGFAHPIDGRGPIEPIKSYPVERVAAGVIYRKSVDTPLQTGIKAIDALIPIGRGQRELIIGDRGVGKSTIAVDTILNQKNQNVICVYNMVGQRESKTAATVDLLTQQGAMDYTVVVAASAAAPAGLQYISPYVACALGEYFMDQGRDVLVIYDDLTKHAWAYRQISLVLRRPSGREAYPGDIFYLHARLLERACRMDDKYGGGSLTALPIIETQEGDVASYIPTNVISITDGQIFLEADLFNAGIRPAINIGVSVSRVGSAAQTKMMKQVAGRLKFDLAQYRELAAFSQFESDLDTQTKKLLDRGARMTQILRQNKHQPLDLVHQVIIFWVGVNGYLDRLPASAAADFEKRFFQFLEARHHHLIEEIGTSKILDKPKEEKLRQLTEVFLKTYESASSAQKN